MMQKVLICITLIWVMMAASSEATTIPYCDKLGRLVHIKLPVQRAVFFQTYELIPALSIWDKVVGIGKFAYDNDLIKASKPDIHKTIPSAGSGIDVNIEVLLKLKPDLVITWTSKPEQVSFMEENGLKVITLYPESLSELYDVMELHGTLFKKEREMERSIGIMDGIFRLIKKRVTNLEEDKKKRVLYISSKPTSVACGIGINNDILNLIGGINPASSIKQRNADIPMEKIIAWNPEFIFIWGHAKYNAHDILTNPQWRSVKAVRSGKVFKAPEWSTWSPRLAPVALWMAMKTYPELFTDINLERMTDDFYRKVFNIPYEKVKKFG